MYDIAIIGGGINGCGIARDAAGRGYSVFLAEKGDLASGTSSASTKLIHGGLRYLEHYEFRLVREALKERDVLLGIAPHIIWPMRFTLPYRRGLRPRWLIRLGLFLYDHLAGSMTLPGARTIDLRHDKAGDPLNGEVADKAFEYSDCWVDDARLVVLNARDAADHGATVRTRCAVTRAIPVTRGWQLETRNERTGETNTIEARIVVNAAGPWIDNVLGTAVGSNDCHNVRTVQGSHIVVPKLFEHDRSYIFQNDDNRIIFAIPYEDDFTLIGTTDRDYTDNLDKVEISEEEILYLCNSASEYFSKPVQPTDVVWTYSGLRPLLDDGASAAQEVTRDYVLRRDRIDAQGELLNIFGGKITTYRKLAEAALVEIDAAFERCSTPWTAKKPLPGGGFDSNGQDDLTLKLTSDFPFVVQRLATRLIHSYGTRSWDILAGASTIEELGVHFGADLTEREVNYLREFEWAESADDILWRRTKLGLKLTASETTVLTDWLVQDHKTAKGSFNNNSGCRVQQ